MLVIHFREEYSFKCTFINTDNLFCVLLVVLSAVNLIALKLISIFRNKTMLKNVLFKVFLTLLCLI